MGLWNRLYAKRRKFYGNASPPRSVTVLCPRGGQGWEARCCDTARHAVSRGAVTHAYAANHDLQTDPLVRTGRALPFLNPKGSGSGLREALVVPCPVCDPLAAGSCEESGRARYPRHGEREEPRETVGFVPGCGNGGRTRRPAARLTASVHLRSLDLPSGSGRVTEMPGCACAALEWKQPCC